MTADGNPSKPLATTTTSSRQEDVRSEFSERLQILFKRFPNLRSQLREIYEMTLEERWNDHFPSLPAHHRGHGRRRSRNHDRDRVMKKRGPWTTENGFDRGLSRVMQWREIYEENPDATRGKDAEGFHQFVGLVATQPMLKTK